MKSNKGFSLVELIIVIAIMAILVGVMAPQLIKYIEKTNVAADTQVLDSLHSAIMTSMADPDVVKNPDTYTDLVIAGLETGAVKPLNPFFYSNRDGAFVENVSEIMNFSDWGNNTSIRSMFRSTPAKSSGLIMLQYVDGVLYIWIDHSDSAATKLNNVCTNYSNLDVAGVIYVY